MKKFLVKLCMFMFILSTIILLLSWLYNPIKLRSFDTNKFHEIPEHIDICNFGSSHGKCGFDYAEVSDKYSVFNFGLSGQSFMYDYRILQNHINRINEGGIVFIVVSYFSFFGEPETEAKSFISMNNRYYEILPPNLIKNYDIITDYVIKYFPIMTFNTRNVLDALKNEDEAKKTAEKLDDIKDVGKKRAEFHFDMIKGRCGIRYSTERIEALRNIIALCREKKLIPILVTTPYLTEYSSHFKSDTEFMKEFKSVLQGVIASENVKYYDYSEDERFSHDYTLFIDTDHLNRNGALKFTNILINDVMHDLK